jgi:hypothetical protein
MMCQSSQTCAYTLLFVCGVNMSGILYFYGFLFHQELLYENKVLPQNVVMYASQVLDVVM